MSGHGGWKRAEGWTDPWSDDPSRIPRLISLWDNGVSAAEIGKRLGVSKNTVIGKAHRLKLTARVIIRPKPEPKPEPEPAWTGRGCMWPFGDPRADGFHFCGGKPMDGKPYCEKHVAIAYVPVKPMLREGEAAND